MPLPADPKERGSETTWEESPPPIRAWAISLASWVATGWPVGFVLAIEAGGSRPALPPLRWIGASLLWTIVGVVVAVHTVRVFFRTIGAWKKLLVLLVPVATVPLQFLMAKIGFATPGL